MKLDHDPYEGFYQISWLELAFLVFLLVAIVAYLYAAEMLLQ